MATSASGTDYVFMRSFARCSMCGSRCERRSVRRVLGESEVSGENVFCHKAVGGPMGCIGIGGRKSARGTNGVLAVDGFDFIIEGLGGQFRHEGGVQDSWGWYSSTIVPSRPVNSGDCSCPIAPSGVLIGGE